MPKAIKRNQTEPVAGARARCTRFLALSALLAMAFIALALVTRPASPQSDSTQTQATTTSQPAAAPKTDPPGTIDGAKNPELIPDEVALRMIVLAVAESADAPPEAKARARAKLNPIGLSDEDATAVLDLLADYQSQADAVGQQEAAVLLSAPMPHPDSTAYKQLVDLGKQKNDLVTSAVAALPMKLSAEGRQKLAAFLPQAKRGMKIIPTPPMQK